jgi:hypothetical protein
MSPQFRESPETAKDQVLCGEAVQATKMLNGIAAMKDLMLVFISITQQNDGAPAV